MEKRPCGSSGIELSVLGIGCWTFGGGEYWGPQDERDVADVVGQALDAGINYFDTAPMYNDGRSEESLGRALQGRRQAAIVGTKILPQFAGDPATLRRHCEASLRRLQTDYIDIYMVHWPIADRPMDEAFATLAALQAEGKIRAIGISNHGVQQMTQAQGLGASIAVNQLCYSLVSRAIEIEVLPFCAQHGIGVIAYMPLMQGLLAGNYRTADEVPMWRARTRHFRGDRPNVRHGEPGAEAETFAALDAIRGLAEREGMPMSELALAWAKARPEITCVLAGIRTARQLTENAAAMERRLSPDLVAELNRVSQPVLDVMGANADYFQAGANGRVR